MVGKLAVRGIDSSAFLEAREAKNFGEAYRIGFKHLIERQGQDAADELVREAVLEATQGLRDDERNRLLSLGGDEACRSLLGRLDCWFLRPSVAALGRILTNDSEKFGRVITTNFDPLIEVATRKAGGSSHRTVLDRDGDPGSHEGDGTHVLYVHGYWYGDDTLHNRLERSRSQLQRTLERWFEKSTVIVLGYGGWDDVIMMALSAVASDANARTDIVWGFYGSREEHVVRKLEAAGDRATFFENVNMHTVLMALERQLSPSVSKKKERIVSPRRTVAGAPKILLAGPMFGLSTAVQTKVCAIWRDHSTEHALERISRTLRNAQLRHAQLAAILRYDVIIDLSPWRSFSSRWSLGLHDAEQGETNDGVDVPLAYFVFSQDTLPRPDDASPQDLLSRLSALREMSWFVKRIDSLADRGFAVAGFHDQSTEWASSFLAFWPAAPVLRGPGTATFNSSPNATCSAMPLGSELQQPTLRDYLLALRVVAGQVTLPGDRKPRPIRDVYVDMEVQRRDIRPVKLSEGAGPRGNDERTELHHEVEARRKDMWQTVGAETIPASALHQLARRIVLWGPAGTGKSTLLRHLACELASEGRVAVWLPELSNLGEEAADQLAVAALRAVGLTDGVSPARDELRAAIERGGASLFLDAFDLASASVRNALPERILEMHHELRVVVASRPLGRRNTGLFEITLRGVAVTGAAELLRAYFGDAAWIDDLLGSLSSLPDGAAWTTNPLLLCLAAKLYQRTGGLPDSTLSLYDEVVNELLERLSQDKWPIEDVRLELCRLARRMLLPDDGDPRATVMEHELPYAHREALLASGFLTGDERLQFIHLTFGEYFAARAGIDLAAERRREAERFDEDSVLEVLPMAHARGGKAPMQEALQCAINHDTPHHPMLRLVLRAISYGGTGVRAFCARDGANVLKLVAERIAPPSGRFGREERFLMADAERACPNMRRFGGPDVRGLIEEKLATVLAAPGEAGTEAAVLVQNLGGGNIERRSSRWWETLRRQARALVRNGVDVDGIVELTDGCDQVERSLAIEVLGDGPEFWSSLRPLLDHESARTREHTIRALSRDAESTSAIRERLGDDDMNVRAAAVWALGTDPKRRGANLDLLLSSLEDRADVVQSAAVTALMREVSALPQLRNLIRRSNRWRHRALELVIVGLKHDPSSHAGILRHLKSCENHLSAPTLKEFVHDTVWCQAIRTRLDRKAPEATAITALSEDPQSRSRIRDLLRHADPYVQAAAVGALAGDRDYHPQLCALLQRDGTAEIVQVACVEALASAQHAFSEVFHRLNDQRESLRCAAIRALCKDHRAIEAIRARLQDEEHNPKIEAIRALAGHLPLTRESLWECYEIAGTQSGDPWARLHGGFVRATVIQQLRYDPESRQRIVDALTDEFSEAREAAISAMIPVGRVCASFHRDKIRMLTKDSNLRVRGAAVKALSDEPEVRKALVAALRDDNWPLRLLVFRLLTNEPKEKAQILDILRHGPQRLRASTVDPLSRVRTAHVELSEFRSDDDDAVSHTIIGTMRHDPEFRRLLREDLRNSTAMQRRVGGTFDRVVSALADDPEAHPLFLDMSYTADNNLLATLVPAMASFPAARARLHEILVDDDTVGNERAAAIRALGGDTSAHDMIVSLLDHDERLVRAAAVEALSDEASVRPRIRREMLSDKEAEVRKVAIQALAADSESHPAIRDRIRVEEEPELKAGLIRALNSDPSATSLLREHLADPNTCVRIAAAEALSPSPTRRGAALERSPVLRHAVEFDHDIAAMDSSGAPETLRGRLGLFTRAPKPMNLDEDRSFAEIVLGWLCARLAWASADGTLRTGRILGETEHPIVALLDQTRALVIRVAMDATDLPRERLLRPTHNLMEAWRVGKHLYALNPPALILACADVSFDHLTPRPLKPGEVVWGPGQFGFRLNAKPPSANRLH